MINKYALHASLLILLVSVVLYSIHAGLYAYVYLPEAYLRVPFSLIYFLLVPLSLITVWFVLWRFKKDHTAAGRSYFITVFVKMFAAVFFLYPGNVISAAILRETVIQFMPVFFVLLFIETFLLVRLLNGPLGEK